MSQHFAIRRAPGSCVRTSCMEAAAMMPAILDGIIDAPVPVVTHLESCANCNAELARYRRLLRLLGELSEEHMDAPPGLVTDVLALLGGVAQRRVIRSTIAGHSVVSPIGLSFGVAVAAIGVAVARSRASRSARGAESRA